MHSRVIVLELRKKKRSGWGEKVTYITICTGIISVTAIVLVAIVVVVETSCIPAGKTLEVAFAIAVVNAFTCSAFTPWLISAP